MKGSDLGPVGTSRDTETAIQETEIGDSLGKPCRARQMDLGLIRISCQMGKHQSCGVA